MRTSRRRRLFRRSLGLAIGLLAAVAPPALAAPAPLPFVERNDNDLMLLEVTVDQYVLSHDLTTYRHPGGRPGALLPLGELSRALGLAVSVTPEQGTAEGFVIREDRPFKLDVRRGKAVLQGTESSFDPALVEIHADDLYVDATLVAKWLPVELEVDPFAARLRVRPKELLPAQLRMVREGRATSGLDFMERPAFPRLEAPYRMIGWPAIDQQLNVAMRGYDAGQPGLSAQYATLVSGETLFMNGQLFLAGSDRRPLSEFRLTLDRKDPAASLFGPLKATELSIGHFVAPGLSLGASSSNNQGIGVMVSNFPLTQPNRFDRHTFRGNASPGWDVELYRGEVLVGHTNAGEDGRYAFPDVPLLFGLNDFRLVFYGPQGQRREEVHHFNVNDAVTPPGQHRYRVTGQIQSSGGPGATVQYDVGLLKQLSATLGAATSPGPTGQQQSALVGLRGYHGSVLGNVELGLEPQGPVGQAGLQTRLGPLSLSARHNRALASWQNVGARTYRSQSDLRLDGFNLSWSDATLGAAIDTGFDEGFAGSWRGRLGLPLSLSLWGFSATNRLSWDWLPGDPQSPFAFQGGMLQLGTRWDVWGLRGDVGYGVRGLHNVALTGDARELPWGYTMGATVGYQPQDSEFYALLSLTKNLGAVLMGLDASKQGLGLSLFSGLQTDPALGPWRPSAVSQAGSAAVLARAFLDLNRNGRWDAGEPPLEGVGITAETGRPVSTAADGTAVLSGLPAYGDTDFSVALDTLTDPLWNSLNPGVKVYLRPSQLATIDFPIVASGEVTGTIYLKRSHDPEELAGARLELVDAKGAVVMKTSTAYDGFYSLYGVAPGTYKLRLPPEQFKQGLPRGLIDHDIIISPKGTLIEGLDMTLEFAHDQPAHPTSTASPALPAKAAEPAKLPRAAKPANPKPSTQRTPQGARGSGTLAGSFTRATKPAERAR